MASEKNPGIDFIVASEKNPGIDFYSGFRKNTCGVQFEILKNPGIDFIVASEEMHKGGVQLEIPQKM